MAAQNMEVLIRVEKILVIQTAFIGDALLTLPMLQKLKEMYPGCYIDVLCIPVAAEIFKASPAADDVIVMDKRGKHKSIFKLLKFIKGIKENNYTKIFSPHRSFRSAFIVMQSRVRETYGFDNSSLFHIYKYIIPYKQKIHEVERNLDLIGYSYDESSWRVRPELDISDETKNKIKKYLSSENITNKTAAVAPGTVWETKKYPPEYFAELIIHLENKGYTVLLLGSQNDKELCGQIAQKSGGAAKVTAGMFGITESVELLKNCDLLISNDSAPTHFAMAAGTKTLTIYCSTTPSIGFYPYTNNSSFISYDELDCKPCGIHGYNACPINTFACAYKLLPANVIKKIDLLLTV